MNRKVPIKLGYIFQYYFIPIEKSKMISLFQSLHTTLEMTTPLENLFSHYYKPEITNQIFKV